MRMTIGVKIQNLRKQKGLSQEQLAEAVGVSRQAVSKWEAEQSVPDIDKIILICDYFGVTTDYILRNEEIPCTETVYSTNKNEEEKDMDNKKKSTLLLTVAVMLYILCAVPIIIIPNQVGLVLLLVMVAVATGMMIFRSRLNSSDNNDKEEAEKEPPKPENPILKAVKRCVWVLAIVVYIVISFSSGAWYITWLVFPIIGAIIDVIKACFDLKDGDNK